jgi:cytochrome c
MKQVPENVFTWACESFNQIIATCNLRSAEWLQWHFAAPDKIKATGMRRKTCACRQGKVQHFNVRDCSELGEIMLRMFKLLLSMFLTFGFVTTVFAGEHGSAAEAEATVKKAVAFVKANGRDKLLAEVSNPKGQFLDRDLYLSVYDMKGTVLAHGVDPSLVGKDVSALSDPDGKPFIRNILLQAKEKGKGREDYKWTNPNSKEYQAKQTYFEVVDDLIISCGYYKY